MRWYGETELTFISVAHAKIYMTVSALFPKFEVELYKTSYKDIEMQYDFFTAATGMSGKGVRIRVIGEIVWIGAIGNHGS
jgi:hypothetical protein